MSRIPYIEGKGYALYPLEEIDRDNYVELHRQINGEESLFLNPHIKDLMWEATINDSKNKYFSIYDINEEYCGSIEIQNHQSITPEIGIDLLECKRNQGIAQKAVSLLASRFCKEQNIEYFIIRILSTNNHSKHVFEKMGAVFVDTEENPNLKIIKSLKELMPEKNINVLCNSLKIDANDSYENEFVCKYKLSPEVII